jgi:hypothetical protein
MLVRGMTGLMGAPMAMGAGLVFAAGVAAGVGLGAGLAGAALIGKRMWEERQGWKAGADTTDPLPDAAGMDAPMA